MNYELIAETVAPISGTAGMVLSAAAYADTLNTVYIVFLIISAVLTILSLVITLVFKIKNALSDGKVTKDELDDILGTVGDIKKEVDKTVIDVSKKKDDAEGDAKHD